MKKQTLTISFSIAFCLILLFSLAQNIEKPKQRQRVELTETEMKKVINDNLKIQVMDRTLQADGKVTITYTNLNEEYEFKLSLTGLKYETIGGRKKYLKRNSIIVIPPANTVSSEISIPLFIYPKVAYPFADDVKIFLRK